MKRKVNIWLEMDWLTVLFYLLLVGFGLINIYAAVYRPENPSLFDTDMRYGKQAMWIGFAIGLAILILIIDARFYQFIAYPVFGVMIVTLVGVLLFGTEVNGARSWFQVGPFRLQPAEFAKVATSLALAKYLSSFNFKIHKLKSIIRIGLIIFLPAICILLQNDTGSALVYFAFILALYREGISGSFLMIGLVAAVLFILAMIFPIFNLAVVFIVIAHVAYFIDRKSYKELGLGLLALSILIGVLWGISSYLNLQWSNFRIHFIGTFLASIVFIVWGFWNRINSAVIIPLVLVFSLGFTSSVDYVFNEVLEDHHQARIMVLLGLKQDPHGAGYNVTQSKIAIGSGGFAGKGFLNGTQTKFKFVPEQSTDFIFCTIGEEWGFLGTGGTIVLFVVLLLRLIFLAERQRSNFNRIYGWGVISILFFHFTINIAMTIGLAPVIGIPLPFFSYGGSSLWGFTILLFIFLKLDSTRKEYLQ